MMDWSMEKPESKLSRLAQGNSDQSTQAQAAALLPEPRHTRASLLQYQSLPLAGKIRLSIMRIRRWHDHWNGDVYVSFSGGKDSTVLLDIVRSVYPDVPAVFVDTGLEYPEIQKFVRTFDNVAWLRPKMRFNEVLEKYGYPVVSKTISHAIHKIRTTKSDRCRNQYLYGITKRGISPRFALPAKWRKLITAPFKISDQCCDVMKKRPFWAYERKTGLHPMTGVMAGDSQLREMQWMRNGCNAFATAHPSSTPLAFWSDRDVWAYIKNKDIPYSAIYDSGVSRTGCMFCMFGLHMRGLPNRFQRMKETHPKQWAYCLDKLGLRKVLDYLGQPYDDGPLFEEAKP